jgi:nucleoid-associated protein YgaU
LGSNYIVQIIDGKAEMTTIRNVTVTVCAALLLSFSIWAEDTTQIPAPATASPSPAAAPATTNTASLLREDHPDQYKVVKGDTLWGIASRFLKDPWMWPEIWHVNPQIANPHLIFPGDTIKLIYLEGQPRLTAVRGEAGMAYRADSDSLTQNGASTSSNAVSGDQTLHPSIRVLPLEEPIPAIPLDIINPFLSGNRVVNPGLMEASPYVVQGSQSHVITGAGSELYTRGKLDPKTSVYGIFRQGKVYTDPVTKEVLGVQAIDVGTGKVKTQENDIARVDVVRSTQEVRPGDRLLINQERRVESTFFPSAPDTDVKGNIIDVEGGVTQVGAMSVVAINRGERDQLQSGNVLAIFQRGETLKDPLTGENLKLMDERAGLMMVFVTFEKMSYALVLYADRPLHVGDNFSKP